MSGGHDAADGKISKTNKPIGCGRSAVCGGCLNGQPVAIQRVERRYLRSIFEEEIDILKRLEHENILYLNGEDFRYIAIDVCAETWRQFIENKLNSNAVVHPEILREITKGIDCIYLEGIFSRDIKPDNILISMNSAIGISFLDSCITLNSEADDVLSTPSESIEKNLEYSSVSDTFSAGCVVFVFTTRKEYTGIHPFGNKSDPIKIQDNIQQGCLTNIMKPHPLYEATPILHAVHENDPDNRISLTGIATTKLTEEIPSDPTLFNDMTSYFHGNCISEATWARFHPTDNVLACGLKEGSIALLKGSDSSSTSISNWKTEQFVNTPKYVRHLEWNVDGSLLVATIDQERKNIASLAVYRYPSGTLALQEAIPHYKWSTVWNPYNPGVLSAYGAGKKIHSRSKPSAIGWIVSVNDSGNKITEFQPKSQIRRVEWIAKNQFACVCSKSVIHIYLYEDDERQCTVTLLKQLVPECSDDRSQDVPKYPLRWSDNFKLLASTTRTSIKIWTTESETPLHSLDTPSAFCTSLAWSPIKRQGSHDCQETFILASGLYDGSIAIWELDQHTHRVSYCKEQSDEIWQLSFSANGQFMASLDGYGVIIWNTTDWAKLFNLQLHPRKCIWGMAWNATSTILILCERINRQIKIIEYGSSIEKE